jgi:hypothetical protein
LLLNDFVLKQQFHNAFTGKLSDVAGLFIFPLFWTAFFPRLKSSIFISTALAFTFWKSSYSQGLIETWNAFSMFPIGRTVDYTDLLSLSVLPLSALYARRAVFNVLPRSGVYACALIAIIAFTATSYSKTTAYNNEYQFQNSKAEMLDRISRLPLHDVHSSHWETNNDTFEINFDSCNDRAKITLQEKNNQSIITLREIHFRCPSGGDSRAMLEFFEKEFIDKLKEEQVTRSSRVKSIWAWPVDKSTPQSP